MADNSEPIPNMSYILGQIDRMATYSDSHLAIIWASALDKNLEIALLTKMNPLSRDIKDRTFDGYGPPSNFSAKIDISYALGIFPREFYDALRKINRVRVKFAHSIKVLTFQDPEISAIIDSIPRLDLTIIDRKVKYLKKMDEIDTYLKMIINAAPTDPIIENSPLS